MGGGNPDEQVVAFQRALLTLDRLAARRIITEGDEGIPPFQRLEEIVIPSLERIGSAWEEGKVALSQVYMSGRICEELVDALLPAGKSEKKKGPPMAIAVLEDHHLLGKRVVSAVLRSGGFELLDFGHGIKAEDLARRAVKEGIGILLISTLMLPSALQVRKVREKICEWGANIRIVVGGAPFLFDARLWKEVGADAMGRSAAEALHIVTGLREELS